MEPGACEFKTRRVPAPTINTKRAYRTHYILISPFVWLVPIGANRIGGDEKRIPRTPPTFISIQANSDQPSLGEYINLLTLLYHFMPNTYCIIISNC
jgi:hypothetical protein